MLILSRGKDDRVVLFNASDQPLVIPPGGRIAEIVVCQVKLGIVRLGFDADRTVTVLRSELLPQSPPEK